MFRLATPEVNLTAKSTPKLIIGKPGIFLRTIARLPMINFGLAVRRRVAPISRRSTGTGRLPLSGGSPPYQSA